MIFNKKDLEKYLVFQDDDKEFYIEEIPMSKEWRTRQQEKTYYLILNWIAKHLWYSVYEVKIYMLSWCFGTRKLRLSKTEIEVPIVSQTSNLTKEQWIFFIDVLLNFCKSKQLPIQIESKDIKSLYESYN